MRGVFPATALLGGVLDALPGPAMLLDPAGHMLAGNRGAAAIGAASGLPLPALLETLAPLAPDDVVTALAGVQAVLQTTQRTFSLEFVPADEPTSRWLLQVTAIAADAGGGAVVQVAPITYADADGAPDRRREDTSFRSIFAASLDAMLIAGADGAIIAGNPVARRVLGCDDAALLQLHFDRLLPADTSGASATEAWQRLMLAGQWRGEGRLQVGEELRVLDVSATAHLTPGRHLIIIRDVTESRKLEAQLRQAQKLEAIGLLAGGMAHDFNNLLTVVLANADMVRESLPEELHELRDEVDQMIHAATRGSEMVKKLLAFSRRDTLERRPVSLAVVLTETQALLSRLLPSDITVIADAAPELPEILGDAGSLQHMLLNLATNARDAMPTGGTLTIRGRHDVMMPLPDGGTASMVVITVEDTGRGMDAAVRAQLFEPFFTTKEPGAGTGLGMAMIHGIVQQHGGTIDVQSTVGRGTVVTIGIPVATQAVPDVTPRSVPLVREGAAETILLVEDEEMVRRAGRRILEKHGYRVIQACDGAEALALLRERGSEIALVVSDVVMPRMGGRELYAALRDEGYRMPFLFTSGYTDRLSDDAVALDPSVPVLPKPWTWTELTASVRAALDEGRTRQR